jgi:hypothetical protein
MECCCKSFTNGKGENGREWKKKVRINTLPCSKGQEKIKNE